MSPRRTFRWDLPERTPPHPYRDTALLYAVLACIIVLLGWVTGGSVVKAVGIAAAVFVAATAWSWFRWYRTLRAAARRAALTGEDEPA